MQLTALAGAPTVEWAVYSLAVSPGSVPDQVTFSLTVGGGNSAWVGVADYGKKLWKLDGPVGASGDKVIGGLAAANVSPGNNVFLLVAAYSGTHVTVNGMDVDIDVPAPPKYFITGKLSDITQNIGIGGQLVTLGPANTQVATVDSTVNYGRDNGNYTFMDLDPGVYTVSVPDVDGYDCAVKSIQVDLTAGNATDVNFSYTRQAAEITYTNSIKVLLDAKCVSCHNGSDPGRVRLDSYLRGDSDDAFHHAEDSYLYVSNDTMPFPPVDPLNATQKKLIQDWINVYNKAE